MMSETMPKGCISPSTALAMYPKLNRKTLVKWYAHCAAIDGPLLTVPVDNSSTGPHSRRWIVEKSLHDAVRWYRDDLPQRFVDKVHGKLVWIEAAARETGSSKATIYGWVGACPALGGKPLNAFKFFAWGKTHTRTYIRESDFGKIREFEQEPGRPGTYSYEEMLNLFNNNRAFIARYFNPPTRKRKPSKPHPVLSRIAVCGIRREKKLRGDHYCVFRIPWYSKSDADKILAAPPPDPSKWLIRADAMKIYGLTNNQIHRAERAERINTEYFPVPHGPGRKRMIGRYYRVTDLDAESNRINGIAAIDHDDLKEHITRESAGIRNDVKSLGRSVDELPAKIVRDPAGDGRRGRRKGIMGRPTVYTAADTRLQNDWKSSGMSKADFARQRRLSESVVVEAINRHNTRVRRGKISDTK